MSYHILKEAIIIAHQQLESCSWSEKNAEAFLKVHGLNSEIKSSVIEHGFNAMAYRIAVEDKNKHPNEYLIMKTEKEENPDHFERWRFPAIWSRGCSLCNSIDK